MRIFSIMLLIFIWSPFLLLARNFRVIVEDTTAAGSPGDEIVMGGQIINLTDRTIRIEIVRETNEIPENWTSSLCLKVCTLPGTNSISTEITVGDSVEFSIHFFTNTQPGEGKARLTIREPQSSDFLAYLFKAVTTTDMVISSPESASPAFQLQGNYPNPFNNSTLIRFDTAGRINPVKFQVFNVLGNLIFEKTIDNVISGVNLISYSGRGFNGNVLPSGMYLYRLIYKTSNGQQQSTNFQKFTLVK